MAPRDLGSYERIRAFRRVLEARQVERIEGVAIDLYTAAAVCKVYDALNAENKARFAALPAYKMGLVALELTGVPG